LLESLGKLNDSNRSTILMVTHDAYAASFCKRVVFIKDGQLYKELYRENLERKDFFQEILAVLASLGGGHHDAI